MRKIIIIFLAAACGAMADNVPASTVPTSTVATASTVPVNIAESNVSYSTVHIYEAWAVAMNTEYTFPKTAVPFTEPVNPAMIQLDDPAKLPELLEQAQIFHAAGRTVYLAYSPHRKMMEMYELPAVLSALRTLAAQCDGFAPAYRRSGAHYGEINRNLAALFCNTVRVGNPGIQFLGEVYFGELYGGGADSYGVSVFSYPGCVAFLGVNLPRGSRKHVAQSLKVAGISGITLIEVLLRGVPPGQRYRHHLYIDLNDDN